MKKLLLSIVLLLSVACSACGRLQGKNLQAQSISHIETTKNWYYIYDANGIKTKTLSESIVGKVLSVSGETFTSQLGSWIYTWSKEGKKISTRAAR